MRGSLGHLSLAEGGGGGDEADGGCEQEAMEYDYQREIEAQIELVTMEGARPEETMVEGAVMDVATEREERMSETADMEDVWQGEEMAEFVAVDYDGEEEGEMESEAMDAAREEEMKAAFENALATQSQSKLTEKETEHCHYTYTYTYIRIYMCAYTVPLSLLSSSEETKIRRKL